MNDATRRAILAAADDDFVEGIRFSLSVAAGILVLVFAAAPRGSLGHGRTRGRKAREAHDRGGGAADAVAGA